MSCIPLFVLSAAVMAIVMTKMAARGQTAYSEAAAIVEEIISSIRTVRKTAATGQVVSFTGEKQAVDKYNKSLMNALTYTITELMIPLLEKAAPDAPGQCLATMTTTAAHACTLDTSHLAFDHVILKSFLADMEGALFLSV